MTTPSPTAVRCPTCGYDLRTISIGLPCPECGLVSTIDDRVQAHQDAQHRSAAAVALGFVLIAELLLVWPAMGIAILRHGSDQIIDVCISVFFGSILACCVGGAFFLMYHSRWRGPAWRVGYWLAFATTGVTTLTLAAILAGLLFY